MNAIFLDIDGVLNTENNIVLLKELGEGIIDDICFAKFDDRCVKYLDLIIKKTNAKIIISSTWRKLGLDEMINIWKHKNLPGEIYDLTFSNDTSKKDEQREILSQWKDEGICRGHEIEAYLKTHPEITNYVILDDDTDMLPHQNFVQCNFTHGLDCNAFYETLEFFNQ